MIVMYMGSEAYNLDVPVSGRPHHSSRPSFEVVEGRGLDAQVRQGVSPQFLSKVKVFAVVALVVAAIAVCRVAIFSSAVGTLANNTSMRTELKQAQSDQNDLRIERSVLSSTSRIERIATQTYGMVSAGAAEQMSAGDAAAASAAEQDTAEGATADASTSDSSADAADAASTGASLEGVQQTEGDGSTAGSNAADVDGLA